MANSTSIRIGLELYERARQYSAAGDRTISEQIEFWARVGCAALDNPDLPIDFIAESLGSLAEPHELAQPFVPRANPERASNLKPTAVRSVEAMRQFEKIKGVDSDEVAAWIAEGRENDLSA